MADTPQEVTKDVKTTGKLVFSFTAPSPVWVIRFFRVIYIGTTVFAAWLAATKLIADSNKFEILLIATGIDRTIWLFARSLGIKKTDIMPDEQ